MEQINVMVFGRIVAHQAELEGMKQANREAATTGQPPKYNEDAFIAKAQEIIATTNELFR